MTFKERWTRLKSELPKFSRPKFTKPSFAWRPSGGRRLYAFLVGLVAIVLSFLMLDSNHYAQARWLDAQVLLLLMFYWGRRMRSLRWTAFAFAATLMSLLLFDFPKYLAELLWLSMVLWLALMIVAFLSRSKNRLVPVVTPTIVGRPTSTTPSP